MGGLICASPEVEVTQTSERAADEVRHDALAALGAMRTHGYVFYREFMGANYVSSVDGVCHAAMPARFQTRGPSGAPALGALATLADIALASSWRPPVPPGQRLATVTMTLRVPREALTALVHARAEATWRADHVAASRCRLVDDRGGVLAEAEGTFVVRTPPEWVKLRTMLRRGGHEYAALNPSELDEVESGLLRQVERSLLQGSPDGPYLDFLGIVWETRGSGQAVGRWPMGPHLYNRAGHAQGGALCGALAGAALACFPPDAQLRLVEQYVQFIRPGVGTELRVEAALVRRGHQLLSAEASVLDGRGRTATRALVTLARSGGGG